MTAFAGRWTEPSGRLDDEPWIAHPDERLDRAFRDGIVPPEQRWTSNFIMPIGIPAGDALTVLRARDGILAKRIYPDGHIVDYDNASRFDMQRVAVRNLDDVAIHLAWLIGQPDRAVVRGGIAGGAAVALNQPRLLHSREGEPATLVEVPRRWLALDFDAWPDDRRSAVGDLAAAANIARSALPSAFHGGECLVAATGSHGFKPGIRVRLWFWLSRKVTSAELKFWLKDIPVDMAPFGAAQLTYTSAPVFVDRADPLAIRLCRIPGPQQEVDVPNAETLRPPAAPAAKPVKPTRGLSPYADAALDSACRRIVTAPAGEQEVTINAESFAIGTLAATGAIPADFARRALLWAGRQMPDRDPHRPWQAAEVEAKVNRAFDQGQRQPRGTQRHG